VLPDCEIRQYRDPPLISYKTEWLEKSGKLREIGLWIMGRRWNGDV
jgi:hypothetical protein